MWRNCEFWTEPSILSRRKTHRSAAQRPAINAIDSGMNIAQKTAQTLEQIVENTGTITETIEQIAVDSKEQSEEVDEITKAIEQISAVVQSNSALSEESVATSEELAAQSSMLDSVISKFRLQ